MIYIIVHHQFSPLEIKLNHETKLYSSVIKTGLPNSRSCKRCVLASISCSQQLPLNQSLDHSRINEVPVRFYSWQYQPSSLLAMPHTKSPCNVVVITNIKPVFPRARSCLQKTGIQLKNTIKSRANMMRQVKNYFWGLRSCDGGPLDKSMEKFLKYVLEQEKMFHSMTCQKSKKFISSINL